VVGLTVPRSRLTDADGAGLAWLAAAAVRARLAGSEIDGRVPESAALRAIGASFVTLTAGGALRGCIGTLDPARPLYRDVTANALRAMVDPRLDPVGVAEWPRLAVTVSVLGPPEPVPADRLGQLSGAVRPGIDGLILTDGRRRATFLPAVWHKLPDPTEFVTALLRKGGWPGTRGGALPDGLVALRYEAVEFVDGGARDPL
jgi:uncharacterized protein